MRLIVGLEHLSKAGWTPWLLPAVKSPLETFAPCVNTPEKMLIMVTLSSVAMDGLPGKGGVQG